MVPCRKCDKDISQSRDGLKCADCNNVFHVLCLGDSSKKRGSRTNWRCDDCAFESSSNTSKASGDQGHAAILEAIASLRTEINVRWDTNDLKMEQIRSDISAMNGEILSVKSELTLTQSKADKTELDVERLVEDNKRLRTELAAARVEVSELQQHTRKNNIIISGIPALPRGADVFALIENIAQLIDLPYHRSEINAAHWLPARKGESNTQPMIVSFVSRIVKNEWISARLRRRSLKASELNPRFPSHQIYLNEQLAPETRTIFNAARAHMRNGKLSSVWTSDGRVMVKRTVSDRPFRVVSLQDLDRATPPQHAPAASVPAPPQRSTATLPPTSSHPAPHDAKPSPTPPL